MPTPPRLIHCRLVDCYYYSYYPEGATKPLSSGLCQCLHPENELIVEYTPCSCYRLDWNKKIKMMQKKTLPK